MIHEDQEPQTCPNQDHIFPPRTFSIKQFLQGGQKVNLLIENLFADYDPKLDMYSWRDVFLGLLRILSREDKEPSPYLMTYT